MGTKEEGYVDSNDILSTLSKKEKVRAELPPETWLQVSQPNGSANANTNGEGGKAGTGAAALEKEGKGVNEQRFSPEYLALEYELYSYTLSTHEPGQAFDDEKINRDFRNLNELLDKSQKVEDNEKAILLENNQKRKSAGKGGSGRSSIGSGMGGPNSRSSMGGGGPIRGSFPKMGMASRSSNTPQAIPRENLRRPIIIVPGGDDPMFNMRNIKAFLRDGKYISKEDRIFLDRETKVDIARTIDGVPLGFKVLDNPMTLTASEWDWVVAIICDGTAYQFNSWRQGYQNPVELFSKHLGIYVHYSHEKLLPETVRGWNVRPMTISESQRHLDGAAKNTFWQLVQDFMKTKKPKHLEGW